MSKSLTHSVVPIRKRLKRTVLKICDATGDALCSRTCGGGVFVESRTCPAGSDCVGPSKRYSSCNIQPCPGGGPSFREEQCSKFDHELFEGKYHQWIPYLKAPRKCELNCMPRGERFYYRHAKKVNWNILNINKIKMEKINWQRQY